MATVDQIPSEIALAALDMAVNATLAGGTLAEMAGASAVEVARWRLAAEIIADLVENVRVGVSEIWRTESCVVFIRTAAIEPNLGPGPTIASAHVLDNAG